MEKKNKQLTTEQKALIFIFVLAVAIVGMWFLVLEGQYIFFQQERVFMQSGKDYFEFNDHALPKNNGGFKTLSIDELYESGFLDALRVPKKKTLCDDESWFRVIKNDQGKYEYYGYLKCGRYKSVTDHVGPEIILNDDDTIYLSLSAEYQEYGVKQVFDKHDGQLLVEDVEIDASAVNTKEIGDYVVKYTTYDKLKNKTVKERLVKVVLSLKEYIKYTTNETYFYQGSDVDNLLVYSGMLWRIVSVDQEANTVKLITNDNISNVAFGRGDYDSTNIKAWLNEVFYPVLYNEQKWIAEDSTWCVDPIADSYNYSSCQKYSKAAPVGLLSLGEYRKSYVGRHSYLSTTNSYWLSNSKNTTTGWMNLFFTDQDDGLSGYDKNELVGVRPVINLKLDDIYLAYGDGTPERPLKINDYNFADAGEYLNKRQVGEYVNVSGFLWRISGFDESGNTKLTTVGVIKELPGDGNVSIGYTDKTAKKIFNVNAIGNIGYEVNNEVLKYVNDKDFVEHEFIIPTIENNKKYSDYKQTKVKAKFSIPASYDLFSGVNGDLTYGGGRYYLADAVSYDYGFIIVNSANGIAFSERVGNFPENDVKLVGYLNKNKKIASGSGLVHNPYFVR